MREPIKELYTIAQGFNQLSLELIKLKVRYEQDPLGTLRTVVGKTKQLATNLMQAASGMTPEQFCSAAGEVAGKTIIDIGSAGVLGKLSGTAELFTAIGSVKRGLQTAADIAKGKKVEQLTQTFSRKTLKRAAALVEQ